VPGLNPEVLLQDHRLYDEYVDVVSALEWLFTETNSMPDTVAHFERFPRLEGPDGNPVTPDFSVVFVDGTGVVAEIARIALHEGSVDDLCHQIGRYDALTQLPGAGGQPVDVSHVDVLLLVPLDIGTDVVRRVITERLLNAEHSYKPSHPPCIVQYVAQRDKYVFQRRADTGNGELRDGQRVPALGDWLARGDFKPPAAGFAHVKAQRPFMNDPVAPLYLASQLWTKVFPTLTAGATPIGDYKPLIRTVSELASEVNAMYGYVGKTALRNAMAILVASRCAECLGIDRWRVAWGDLAHIGGEEVGEVLARRTQKPPAKGPIRRLIEAYSDLGIPDPAIEEPPEPGTLF
jgi:hypothetical protein